MFKITTFIRCTLSEIVQQTILLKNLRFYSIKMNKEYFEGQLDRYNGIIVDSTKESCKGDIFSNRLKASLSKWLEEKRRTIWFRVNLAQAEWVPILTLEGFKFHHAKEDYVTLYRWLPKDQESNIPPYSHTNLGIGGFVYNESKNEILVIKEKYIKQPTWKLPGGYVEPGENINVAAEREVLEETGIQTNFKCLIAFRHAHQCAFDSSDIYMIAYLTPLTFDIKKCEREISECTWMKVDEFINNPIVHENNRFLAKKTLEFLKKRVGFGIHNAIHPITKNPVCIYSLESIE
ncbi:uncharacterized protein LOC127288644 [Leptopilina boulardi]|uniref:uncharacterized protein LOC127288644 n=1 Tax=Leptopilina boulardi TaxID=63433 RepID=UPI0021F5661D|nr:uncharacterized protein LOC127288644 [Leptopilina boulardi]